MATKIKPRNGLVTVRKIESGERKTASGLVIPQTQGMVFELCEVVEVGPGYIEGGRPDTHDLEPGQTVLAKLGMRGQEIGQMAYTSVPLTDDKGGLFLLNQSDIVAIVEGITPALNLVTD